MRIILSLCIATLLPFAAIAAEPAKRQVSPSAPALPPPPPSKQSNDASVAPPEPQADLEPEVTITTRGDTTYEEYRANGRLYMIKVTPKNGKPYYLVDSDGGGQFRRSDLEPRTSVPRWVIKSW